MDADELMDELNEEAGARTEEIVASIMDELDLIPSYPSSHMKRKTAGGLAFTSEFVITHVGITRMVSMQ